MSTYLTLIILCALSGGFMALATFSPWGRLGGILFLVWLAAALPVMFFCAFSDKFVLMFYLISAAIAFSFRMGGEKK